MKIEEFRIGQKVIIRYTSEDWYADWKDNLGPYEVIGITKFRGKEEVTVLADGCMVDFHPDNLEDYEKWTSPQTT